MADLTLQQVAVRHQMTEDQIQEICNWDKTFYSQWTTMVDGCRYFSPRAVARIPRDYKLIMEEREKQSRKKTKEQERQELIQKGERLKKVRESLNLSMAKFAETVSINKAAVNNIENGKKLITQEIIDAVCAAHHVNPEWLNTGKGIMFFSTQNTEEDSIMPKPEGDAQTEKEKAVKKDIETIVPDTSEKIVNPNVVTDITMQPSVKQTSSVTEKTPAKKKESARPKKAKNRVTKALFESGDNTSDIKGIREFYIKNNLCPVLEIAASSDEELASQFSKDYILLQYNNTAFAVKKEAWFGILDSVYKTGAEE